MKQAETYEHAEGRKATNPEELLREIMADLPDASEKQVWPQFRNEVLENKEMIIVCLRWYHIYARNRILSEKRAEARAEAKANPTQEERRSEWRESKEKMKAKFKEVKRELLLDHPMPNGKLTRDCTVRYVAKFTGKFTNLVKLAYEKGAKPASLIGKVLTDDEAEAA